MPRLLVVAAAMSSSCAAAAAATTLGSAFGACCSCQLSHDADDYKTLLCMVSSVSIKQQDPCP